MRGSSRSTRPLFRGISLAAAGALTVALLPSGVAAAAPRGSDDVCPAPDGNYELFVDIGGNTHEANIKCLAGYGITQGTTPVTYDPSADVRRDSMASFVVSFVETAIGDELEVPADDQFGDIASSTHRESINKLANAGLVRGTAANTYSPTRSVTRDQMGSFIANAIDFVDDGDVDGSIPPANATNPFTDLVSGNAHYVNILRLEGVGVVSGRTATTYEPATDVSRAQMATFIMQAADYLEFEGFWLPTEPTAPSEPVAATTGEYLNTTIEACTFDNTDDTVEIVARSGDDLDSFVLDLADDTFTVDGDELDMSLRADESTLEAACVEGTIADIDYDTAGVSAAELFTADADRVTNTTTGDNTSSLTEAIAAADAGDELIVRGDFDEGTIVLDESITLTGEDATVAGSFHVTGDDVTISGFEVSDLGTVLGEVTGIYLQGVDNVTLLDNAIDGTGTDGVIRGIIATDGTAGVVDGNVISDATTGVSITGAVQLDITGNQISDSVAGIGTDTTEGAVVAITGNTLTDNQEGVGIGGPGVVIADNAFVLTAEDGEVYVTNYTAGGFYNLDLILATNDFAPEGEVEGNAIVPIDASV